MARKIRRPAKKQQTLLARCKRKAPKIPDFTCQHIDDVINILEEYINTTKEYTKRDHKKIVSKLEMLRGSNESLRDSGRYWYDSFKQIIKEFPKLKYHKLGKLQW